MKKNKATKIAAFLLIITLVTASVVSEVFAKYTSKADNGNTAAVGKWGVAASAEGSLFTSKDSAGNYTVAPGDVSSGKGLNISLNGKAGVDGEISFYVNQQNIFLSSGTWGIMVEAENVPVSRQSAINSAQGAAPQVDNKASEADNLQNSSPEASSPDENAEGGEPEAGTAPEGSSAEKNTQDGDINVGSMALAGEAAPKTMQTSVVNNNTRSADSGTVYYKLSGGVYTAVDSGSLTAGTTYYVMKNQVTLAKDYWPVVFKMTGDGSVGYVPGDTEGMNTNTLKGIADTLKGVLGEKKQFKANTDLSAYGLKNQTITWQWSNCTSGCSKDAITITSGESGTVCDICKYDTILQSLMAQSGPVVKKAADGSYKAPVASTDYCLNVDFGLKMSVNQVD